MPWDILAMLSQGWGIRALNAIPKGSFICTYAGAIYDDNMAIDYLTCGPCFVDFLLIDVTVSKSNALSSPLPLSHTLLPPKNNQEGYGFGDEYQAELDYIETIEKPKEDYEPYAIEPSDSFDEYECASPASLPASSNTSRRS
ncbi:unnamed protein product, partial [Dibothriocephalus latus]